MSTEQSKHLPRAAQNMDVSSRFSSKQTTFRKAISYFGNRCDLPVKADKADREIRVPQCMTQKPGEVFGCAPQNTVLHACI